MALVILLAGGALAEVSVEAEYAPLGRVAAGERHAVVILEDGTCLAFGDDTYGQCDIGDWQNVIAVAAGEKHTVALMNDGTCAAAGDNAEGQLNVSEWRNVIAITAGRHHTVALFEDGTCAATGINGEYKYDYEGNRTFDNWCDPCDVGDWTNVISIAAGNYITLGLQADGTVLAAGALRSDYSYSSYAVFSEDKYLLRQLDMPKNVRGIAAGAYNSALALFDDGTLDCVGPEYLYGITDMLVCSVCYAGINRFIELDSRIMRYWTDIVAIYAYGTQRARRASFGEAAFGLRSDGTVVMASEDYYGQGVTAEWTDIVDMAAGGGFVIGVKSDGTILSAGRGVCAMPELTRIRGACDIFIYDDSASADYYAFGLMPDGTLCTYSPPWEDWWGDIIPGMDDYKYLSGVKQVACAPSGYIALMADGTTYVGNPIIDTQNARALFALDKLKNISAVAAGGTSESVFALALDADGYVYTAGNIEADWTNVKQIAAAHNGAVCVHIDGTVSVSGSLADTYADCAAWTDIVDIALGHNHIVGLKSDGTCVAAGDNTYGQLEVSAFERVKQIAAGARHTLVLFEDGTCAAVGDDMAGGNQNADMNGALDVAGWQNVKRVRACDGMSIGFTVNGETLLTGLGAVDISGIEDIRLWTGDRRRADAPLITPSENTERIRACVTAARADYARVMELTSRRSEAAIAAKLKHPEFDDVWSEAYGLMLYRQNGLYGFLNMQGEVALPAEYIDIERQPSGGMYILQNKHGYGFADMTGAVRVPCQYGRVYGFDDDGYAFVGQGDNHETYVWIDKDGDIVSEPSGRSFKQYDDARYIATNIAGIHTSVMQGFADAFTGETVLPDMLDRAFDFEDELALICIQNHDAYITQAFMLASPLEIRLP